MVMKNKFACVCCEFLTKSESKPGSYEICPVCFWEDDLAQFEDKNYAGGANKVSLSQARQNFKKFGAFEESFRTCVRSPLVSEIP